MLSDDGLTDTSQQPSGVMVNADGEFVVAEPDQASWDQYQAKTKLSAMANEAAETSSKDLQERGFECPIDRKLFIDPTQTPCCKRTYCNDCIINALIESDFKCPGCQSEGILIDDLLPDDEVVAKIKAYLDERDRQMDGRKQETAKSGTPPSKIKEDEPTKTTAQPAATLSPSGKSAKKTTESPKLVGASNLPKKRPAEERLESPRILSRPSSTQGVNQRQQLNSSKNNPTSNLGSLPNGSLQSNLSLTNLLPGQHSFSQGMGPLGQMPAQNYMSVPLSFGPAMGMNPAMMGPNNLHNFGGNPFGFPGMGGPPLLPQQYGQYPGGYNGNFMMNGGLGGYGQNMQMQPMSNSGMGMGGMNGYMNSDMSGMMQQMAPAGGFPNQQLTAFSEPLQDEEDNAYFRKPVNPHRHQARQRRVRPSDYREV